jgi:hypothetical protein
LRHVGEIIRISTRNNIAPGFGLARDWQPEFEPERTTEMVC